MSSMIRDSWRLCLLGLGKRVDSVDVWVRVLVRDGCCV